MHLGRSSLTDAGFHHVRRVGRPFDRPAFRTFAGVRMAWMVRRSPMKETPRRRRRTAARLGEGVSGPPRPEGAGKRKPAGIGLSRDGKKRTHALLFPSEYSVRRLGGLATDFLPERRACPPSRVSRRDPLSCLHARSHGDLPHAPRRLPSRPRRPAARPRPRPPAEKRRRPTTRPSPTAAPASSRPTGRPSTTASWSSTRARSSPSGRPTARPSPPAPRSWT